MNVYGQIGKDKISDIISTFYARAFADPIIGHFFLRIDQQALIQHQIAFVTNMLGGPRLYKGRSLDTAHAPFKIRDVHFNRRQVLLEEVLREFSLSPQIIAQWLAKEEKFRAHILTHDGDCNSSSV